VTKRIGCGLAGLVLGLAGTIAVGSAASADRVRRIYSRSPGSRVAGGPPAWRATLLPGQSLPVRLSRPGQIAISAYCGLPGSGAGPVTQASFDYEAVLDRCFIRFGSDEFFASQLGRGFFGTQETAPFTVNNPKQGDIVLGPSALPVCRVPNAVLSRRG